mmetsp:Transcript_39113/g.62463  ORF Transcript_39113/g.62463 Transcript_39113/m.62463 type:complete len:194 (-) Transcript_39113:55-636(-)
MKAFIAWTLFLCAVISTFAAPTPRPTGRPTYPTPRPTQAPTDSYRQTYVSFNISKLAADDFTQISNNEVTFKQQVADNAEQTALDDTQIATSYGGYDTFSGSSVTTVYKDETAGTCDVDALFWIYWEAADRFEEVLKTTTFQEAMETLLNDYFNGTEIEFSVDQDTIRTLSVASMPHVFGALVAGIVVSAFSM